MGQDRLHCVPLKKYVDSPFLASVANHHGYEKNNHDNAIDEQLRKNLALERGMLATPASP